VLTEGRRPIEIGGEHVIEWRRGNPLIFQMPLAQSLDVKPMMSVDDVLSPFVYVFYAAFIVAFIFTPLMQAVATFYGIIDQPDGNRKMHKAPVAYLGGVAVFLGWMAGLAISQFTRLNRPGILGAGPVLQVRLSIIIGACAIVLLGLWDDIRHIKPRYKIIGQVCAAAFLLTEGIGIHCALPLLEPIEDKIKLLWHLSPDATVIPPWISATISAVLVVCVVVGCCNATNLMDGLDGLCGGVTAIIAAGFLFLAVHLAVHQIGDANLAGLRVVLGLALLGAVLGFVPYNFNPASIFMGDTGSLFLGYCCAVMIVLLAEQQSRWFLAALVMFALPILDTSLAFARRFVNRRPLFSADRYHFHHQLVARGFSVRRTVVISYALSIGFALLGGSIVFVRTRYAAGIYLVVFGSIIITAFKMGMIHEKTRIVSRSSTLQDSQAMVPGADLEPTSVLEIRPSDHAALPTGGFSSPNAVGVDAASGSGAGASF
jgi:UDP-GlcNAc:undecaprenyl-phosphate GlcNAc-1-phosphate transferase